MKKKGMFRIISLQMGVVPKVLIDILKNLDRDKFELFVLLNINQGDLLKDIPVDVNVIALQKGKEQMSRIRFFRFFQMIKRNIILKLYKHFPSLIKRKIFEIPDIEIAITHSSLPELLKSPFRNSKKINWFHTDIIWHHSKDYGKDLAKMMQKCDLTVFVSLYSKITFEKYLNVKLKNSLCIHNPFDVNDILYKSHLDSCNANSFFSEKVKTFVSTGRLVFAKGYDVLIDVHAELLDEGFDHRIIVIGDGNELIFLQRKIRTLGVESSFVLLGNINNPYPYIKNADYYIQPSRYESYPIALGEALILNIPIICTDVGGVSELLSHEKTAYIVNFEKDTLKEAMKNFMQNTLLIEKIRKEQSNFQANEYNRKIYSKINNILLKISRDEVPSEL